MANSLITDQKIALAAIPLWKNTNAMLAMVNQEYTSEFARTGAKAGQSIRIRKPVDYPVQSGPTTTVSDTIELNTTLTVATQKNVSMSFSSADRELAIGEFTGMFIRPAVNNLAGAVAGDLMAGAEGGSAAFASKNDPTTGALITPDMFTWLAAGAAIDLNSVPTPEKVAITHPMSMAASVSTFSNLFNSQSKIGAQYDNGYITHALGFDWANDQTVRIHTTGTLATSPTWVAGKGFSFGTVNGASQTGSTLTVTTTTGTLKQGDMIRIAGVNAVNRINKTDTGSLQTFTVTADVASGATSIPIYPAITPGSGVAYQTVTASPANSAVIYSATGPSSQYRKNLVFHPKAITLAMVDLASDLAGAQQSRANLDGVSMRVASQWAFLTDQNPTRLDILYGLAFLMPEWVATVADPVS
jgi:hypothetical protein